MQLIMQEEPHTVILGFCSENVLANIKLWISINVQSQWDFLHPSISESGAGGLDPEVCSSSGLLLDGDQAAAMLRGMFMSFLWGGSSMQRLFSVLPTHYSNTIRPSRWLGGSLWSWKRVFGLEFGIKCAMYEMYYVKYSSPNGFFIVSGGMSTLARSLSRSCASLVEKGFITSARVSSIADSYHVSVLMMWDDTLFMLGLS